jgi:tripartite-type tricarboxylate transporter receptor subunit TctC
MRSFPRLLAALALAAVTGAVQAQAYPSKPIRLVVTFPPGGPADIIARTLANKMSSILGQQVIVDNKGGAGGVIGVENVAKSPPDGYSLVLGSAGATAVAPSITKLPYDVEKNLVPLTQVVSVPEVVVAIPKLGIKTLPELVAYAKANPGKVSFASSGNAGMPHLAGELLKREAGIDMTHVPYRGAAPAVNDLLGGQVDVMFADIPILLPHINSGKLVALALGSEKRAPSLPNLPTTGEAGLPRVIANNWYGLFVTGGTPKEITAKLTQAAITALKSDDVRETLAKQGAIVVASTPEEFNAFLRAERAKWGAVAKTAGIKWGE